VSIDREEGRRAFGADAAGYDEARPEYPERVYETLVERCGLGPGCAVLEIGPGTGLATRRLAALGASPLVAVEPDERLAAYLEAGFRDSGVSIDVRNAAFEDVDLAHTGFDLAVSATAFHWVDQAVGLRKLGRVIRPGGWWAAWWTVFGDPDLPDPFHDATVRLMQSLRDSPSAGVTWRAPFALDCEARLGDLAAAGVFEAAQFERHASLLTLDVAQVRALYGTFSSVNVLPPSQREALLDMLARVADNEFAGQVERRIVTAVYTARRRD
jgi:SAM-dependent methyltransferase